MWKRMLKTDLLEIEMDETNQLLQFKLNGKMRNEAPAVLLNQADIIQLMHALLEINRTFRGDVPYYAPVDHAPVKVPVFS